MSFRGNPTFLGGRVKRTETAVVAEVWADSLRLNLADGLPGLNPTNLSSMCLLCASGLSWAHFGVPLLFTAGQGPPLKRVAQTTGLWMRNGKRKGI